VKTVSGAASILAVAISLLANASSTAQAPAIVFDPHGDPQTGVLRVLTDPPSRGECQQCHPTHGDETEPFPSPPVLFTENDNRLAFWNDGIQPCHSVRPENYPLAEQDRMPESAPDPGYFEANVGGLRRAGVQYRGRWPGELVYTNPGQTPRGHWISPHGHDPDMPRKDSGGEGLCLNCHDPHGNSDRRDLLVADYGGVGGRASVGPPQQYALCFWCHGTKGAAGMEPGSRFVEDYYDAGLNGSRAGHQIRKNPRIALSWPAHVQAGDMLPCYDCHNPHGSQGNNRSQPNGYLISDERQGWSGLTDPLDYPPQARAFCLGCHILSDGIAGSQVVEGIVMNTLSDDPAHRSSATAACPDCHGRDYTGPTSNNAHNPGAGVDKTKTPGNLGSPWEP
jgi:cytochrome c553